ncbi:MAG TPA: helix-turn-helix transcriptional regulator [Cyclobacteriaceae bacterium]|jgi:transcriptional regulator with XRE-family HTH domain|nr:helix-turn-helix transcriptional regulator [Cyclobacteriaceae bacterium]
MTGEEIRDLRKSRKKNQTQFAKELNISRDSIARYELDIMQPGPEVQQKLDKMMGKKRPPSGISQYLLTRAETTGRLVEMFDSLNGDDRIKGFEAMRTLYLKGHKDRVAFTPG